MNSKELSTEKCAHVHHAIASLVTSATSHARGLLAECAAPSLTRLVLGDDRGFLIFDESAAFQSSSAFGVRWLTTKKKILIQFRRPPHLHTSLKRADALRPCLSNKHH